MDNLGMLVLALVGIAGFVRIVVTDARNLPSRIGAVVALVWLVVFMVVTLTRIDSQWWTGNAQASWVTIALMALGFIALLDKQVTDGGEPSKC